tara:strand:+ start:145 stop:585 length:441 start_codon:yes stop_codon:yes gene_type:complete
MQKKGYDILSWIFLVVIIVLFSYNIISVNSMGSDFEKSVGNDLQRAIDSGNFSQINEARENMNNFAKDSSPKLLTVNSIKYSLYALGTIYSIIIFILCFRLKTGILEKLIVLIGGIITYGGLAVLTYFFDVRKKFNSIDPGRTPQI